MNLDEYEKRVANALIKLKEAGDGGMDTQVFFDHCRKLDKENEPLKVLKELFDGGRVGFVLVSGVKTTKIRYIVRQAKQPQ